MLYHMARSRPYRMQNMAHSLGAVDVYIAYKGFWQVAIRAKKGCEDHEPGELLEILEFHPTSDLWEVREHIAAMDRKSSGRWCREGDSMHGEHVSREQWENAKRIRAGTLNLWPFSERCGCEGCES